MNNIVFCNYNYLGDGYLDIVMDADFSDEIKNKYECPLIYVICHDGEIKNFILCDFGHETDYAYSTIEKETIQKFIVENDLLSNADWAKVRPN